MTPDQCIRAAIPNADDALVDHIFWGRTAYPFSKLTARALYKAASSFKRAADHGIQLCDLCDNIAVDGFNCKKCNAILQRCRS